MGSGQDRMQGCETIPGQVRSVDGPPVGLAWASELGFRGSTRAESSAWPPLWKELKGEGLGRLARMLRVDLISSEAALLPGQGGDLQPGC